jgi:hypothetical protein
MTDVAKQLGRSRDITAKCGMVFQKGAQLAPVKKSAG